MDEFIKMLIRASLTAVPAVCAVMLIRPLMRKASGRWAYLLWAVVFFRCLCPFSVESALSFFNAVPELPAENREISFTAETSVPQNMETGETVWQADNAGSTEMLPRTEPKEPKKPIDRYTAIFFIWLAGAAAMWLYGIISYVLLMNRLKTAVKAEDGVWESDRISTAFSAGFFPPRIYLPRELFPEERRLIVTHERVHIKRLDHIAKLAAFFALTLHWFNPLIWLAFGLMTRDMELSCDEAVLKILGADEKKAYSEALLRVAARQSGFLPPAFAETGIKGRVRNVLKYKKPTVIATVFAAAAAVTVCIVFGTDAGSKPEESNGSDTEAIRADETHMPGDSGLSQTEKAVSSPDDEEYAAYRKEKLDKIIAEKVYVCGGDFIALFDSGEFDILNVYGGYTGRYFGAKDYRYVDNRLVLSFSDGSELYFDVVYDKELSADTLVYNDELSHNENGGAGVPYYGKGRTFIPDAGGSYGEFARIISKSGTGYNGDGDKAIASYFTAGSGEVLSLYSEPLQRRKFSFDNFALSYFRDYYESEYYFSDGFLKLTFTEGSELCFDVAREGRKLTFRKELSRYSDLSPRIVPGFSDGDVLEFLGDGNIPAEILEQVKASRPRLMYPVSADISEDYGDLHGLWFDVPKGTAVIAAADGIVAEAADGYNNGYGTYVKISHGLGRTETVYAHLSEVTVKPGDKVQAGTVIGYSGSTGAAVTAGLFFQVFDGGIHTDPNEYMQAEPATLFYPNVK